MQADRSLDSLKDELEEQDLLVHTPEVEVEDFLAAYSYAHRGQKPGDIESEPSLLAIRSRLLELCVLPLLSPLVGERWGPPHALRSCLHEWALLAVIYLSAWMEGHHWPDALHLVCVVLP